MGIVVCICMLLGLAILQPTPWNSNKRTDHAVKFRLFTAAALLILGVWNVLYAYPNISGFWSWVSLLTGLVMISASAYVYRERKPVEVSNSANSNVRKGVVLMLAVSFLLYAVTLMQLNLGYPILP